VNKGTRNHLEAKLKKMLKRFAQDKAKQERPRPPSGNGNVIRRRTGEKDKRFSSLTSLNCKSTLSQRVDN